MVKAFCNSRHLFFKQGVKSPQQEAEPKGQGTKDTSSEICMKYFFFYYHNHWQQTDFVYKCYVHKRN